MIANLISLTVIIGAWWFGTVICSVLWGKAERYIRMNPLYQDVERSAYCAGWPVTLPVFIISSAVMLFVMSALLVPLPSLGMSDDEEGGEDQYLLEARREVNEMFPGRW